jgi:hypothetical protein
MRALVICAVFSLALLGCDMYRQAERDNQKRQEHWGDVEFDECIQHIHYSRDERTGLCFAGSGGRYASATCVPCTAEVLARIRVSK